MSVPKFDIDAMTVGERLSLMEALWDSLSSSPSVLQLAPAQQAELNRRIEEMDCDDLTGRDWNEIRDRLLDKKNRADTEAAYD